jgi:hypothetical protein
MVEPYPDRTIWRPFRLNGDGAERQGRGEGCEGLRSDRDLDHAGDIIRPEPVARIAPAPGGGFKRGGLRTLRGRIKGTPSRLGGPARLIRQQVPCHGR